MKTVQDKIRGSLIGGAVGDALGYTVEFMSYGQIKSRYGEKGITRFELNGKGVAEISDDTQMTLFTANGLLIGDMKAAYLEWYHTQTDYAGKQNNAKCWLSGVSELYSRRAPGCTCMAALQSIENGLEAHNNSKGCGGIMRVAPIGIYGALRELPLKCTAKIACEAARLTHKHPLGFLSAGLLAATVQLVAQDEREITRESYINHIMAALHTIAALSLPGGDYDTMNEADELVAGTEKAIELAKQDIPDEQAIRLLGEGWTGEEAWYIAVFCTVKHFDSLEQAIVAAVNHNGDSDSTGAIAGNLIGAIHGYDAIPEHFKQSLELRDVIMKLADDLYAFGNSF